MQRFASLATLLPLAAAHGFIKSPAPRQPGDNYKSICGEQAWYQQTADINGNVQGIMQVVGDDTSDECKLWLCKGFLFEDNNSNVQTYSAGETIDFDVDIAAPHVGYANVSVVKTSTDEMIGLPLIEFQNYADNAGVDANNTKFSVTLPDDFSGECAIAGDCVLQWFWDAPDIDQTYESCVDFTVSGGSGSTPPAEGDEDEDDSSSETTPAPTESVAVSTGGSDNSETIPAPTGSVTVSTSGSENSETIPAPTGSVTVSTGGSDTSETIPAPTEPVAVSTGGSDTSEPTTSNDASDAITTASSPAATPTDGAGEGDECEEGDDEDDYEEDEDCEVIPDDEEEVPQPSETPEEQTPVESESPEASQPAEGGEGVNQYWKPGSGSYWEKGSGSYWEQ